MSRGYPDFSGAAAFPVRKHLRVLTPALTPLPNMTDAAEYTISTQALIDGGFITFGALMDLGGVGVKLQIDGQTYGWTNIYDLLHLGWSTRKNYPLLSTYYDPDVFWATLQIAADYYCGYEYILSVVNATGDDLFMTGCLYYSDVN